MEEEEKTTENPNHIGENRNYDETRDEKGRFGKGNPGCGRPKGSFSITEMIKKKLQEVPEGHEKTYAQQLIEAILNKAIAEQDTRVIKQIWNYMDGMPNQKITFDTEEQEKVQETLDNIQQMMQPNEPQTDTGDVSDRGETGDNSTEVPTSV